MSHQAVSIGSLSNKQGTTAYKILFVIGLCHLLNDSLQAVVPAMFPILEKSMGLSYTQLGMIAFSLNIVASVLQPIIGMIADKKPRPYALPIGLSITMVGVLGLAFSPRFEMIIFSVALIGLGSAIFHPEGSRVAFMASGPRRGLAQSIYQVGGNSGQALAPLITAIILVPLGQKGASWFSIVAATAVGLLIFIARWYTQRFQSDRAMMKSKKDVNTKKNAKVPKTVWVALTLILFLIFARSWYISGMTNYYAFYAIEKYAFTIKQSQMFLFAFLVTGAIGTFFGGPLADRFGKKNIIFLSMIGSAPLTILIPFVPSTIAFALLAVSGFLLMSSFSVTVVYAQELFPGKIGTMAGLTVGLAFGMGALGSVGLGYLADLISLPSTIIFVGTLPLLGIITCFLPSDKKLQELYS
ncbi:MFS transporter [Bacillus sp. 1NLA3E]|uniref:MFS transporter n=1 Tax=Bacillus sp. 1NLA3E TaxID=666686 RepID=UPI000247E829|nr:MFS transporter [Bacillus sp. 1NLA3E]AGK52872.1 putative efflux transporter [Bacillus sp. 1NLA3E]